MENSELLNLKKCKTLIDCARIIYGKDYTNGRIKKEIVEYCAKKYSIDILDVLKQNNRKFCLNCGKEIFGKRKFCNNSCAASYNNKGRKHNEETKEKISKSLAIWREEHKDERKKSLREIPRVCKTCGKTFYSKSRTARFCSHTCFYNSEEIKQKLREKVAEKISKGTFIGWQTRNVTSFPEQFFINVLLKEKIPFIREDFTTKKYFLDFFIEKNGKKIDLEIDGKQHQRDDRKQHDKERDEYLTNLGYIVYRIPWNNVSTDSGKEKMRIKISDFLEFYSKI